ncbi:hypothetical protein ACXN5S_01225 [Pseudoroseicyclus sp. H15]
MAKIAKPVLFSEHFNFDSQELQDAGLFDPFLNADTPLFIDPILLQKSGNGTIHTEAVDQFSKRFGRIVKLVTRAEDERSVAWRAARYELDFSEPPTTGLGYGTGRRAGTSRPDDVRERVLNTTKEISLIGVEDPDLIVAMPFFEEGVGADTISDFTTHAITNSLCKITENFCLEHEIPVKKNKYSDQYRLPSYQDQTGKERFQLLVPRDILQALPAAADWSLVQEAVEDNEIIRKRVNVLLSGIARPSASERKSAVRAAATTSSEIFGAFIWSLKERTESYDPNEDALGYYRMRKILREDPKIFFAQAVSTPPSDPRALLEIVRETVLSFKKHVEDGNLWEELWLGDKPKRERAAQLIYFAIAELYCEFHDVDVSPEVNMGGGPVDFKFSHGSKSRVLVEMKRSSGSVVHGYEKQLEYYKRAAKTDHAIFVVIDYGDGGGKISTIRRMRKKAIEAGGLASEIMVVDASKKASSSKRK